MIYIEIAFIAVYVVVYIIRPIWLVIRNKYERRNDMFSELLIKREPVSIIIPAHNEEDKLRQTVLGLMEQKLGEYEIIIGENNSTDGTIYIARDLERMYPERIKVLKLNPPRNVMPIS